jgi:hypothetical protein
VAGESGYGCATQDKKQQLSVEASVGPALARTLSMGDMMQSVPDAQAPVVAGWSR